ncbi:MAG: 23S rRNA (pseudouridine(1915)-N(3))-methyltransferase RlmH [Rhodospirillales bacterium]|nr:23S rRNA (pseudouridine(1915)-N(3))-methyltransferase RlmH [Rhodospirillales bacterium]
MHVDIIAVGRLRKGSLLSLYEEYATRLRWGLTLYELDPKKPQDEEKLVLEKLDPQAFVFVMDERGKSLSSEDFSQKIDTLAAQGRSRFQFVIGGADGHSQAVRKRSDCLLSFGAQTWPHMLARVMLLEQIYRAQQIIAGHPYHRS